MHFPSLKELSARGTRKWTVYDEDVIPLWIAESDFLTAPAVKEAIQEAVDAESFGYTPAPKACLLYTSPSPRDATLSRMPSSA